MGSRVIFKEWAAGVRRMCRHVLLWCTHHPPQCSMHATALGGIPTRERAAAEQWLPGPSRCTQSKQSSRRGRGTHHIEGEAIYPRNGVAQLEAVVHARVADGLEDADIEPLRGSNNKRGREGGKEGWEGTPVGSSAVGQRVADCTAAAAATPCCCRCIDASCAYATCQSPDMAD